MENLRVQAVGFLRAAGQGKAAALFAGQSSGMMAQARVSSSIILKEGFLYKKGGIMKSWSRRYFVLTAQSLCYFRSEDHQRLEPLGRIFLSDIVNIETEGEKKKAFVFALHTRKRAVLLQAANVEDKEKWVEAIRRSLESDKEAERKDPFRKSLRRLTPGVKRVTLIKDPVQGIGCTIKNAAGHIFVNRILEEGPIAETGVLRPGDELLDIHGVSLSGLSVTEVVDIIRDAPNEFLATVRPVTSVRKALQRDFREIKYADIVHFGNGASHGNRVAPMPRGAEYETVDLLENGRRAPFDLKMTRKLSPDVAALPQRNSYSKQLSIQSLSLEDVGNYDDEEEGDIAPPLPPRTEDALILVDPPPFADFKKPLNIYKTNAHLMMPGYERHSSSCTEEDMFSRHGFAARPKASVMGSNRVHPFAAPKLMKSLSQGDGLDAIPGAMNSLPSQQPPPIPPRNQSRVLAQCSPRSPPRRLYQPEDRYVDRHGDYRHGNPVSFGYALQHHRQ